MSKTKINIGETDKGVFSFPVDAATQTFAFIARRGAGKTYAAGKLVEGFAEAGVQFIVLDSVGNWWGLRVACDGKAAGIDVPLLGGLRGDIPLNPSAGALIADLAVDSGRSLVLDVSQFSKSDRQHFATAFGVRLWQRKKGEESPSPIHLVIEESQLIVPENVGKDQTTMIGTYEEIIRLGRNYGIGCTLITQRPQSVNKEVLNQTECLFVLQVNGAHEREALKKWIVHQGLDTKIVNELPALPQGTAYVWSPQWLGILEKVKIGRKWTFDSTATPKPGQARAAGRVKPIDLEDLKGKMASAVKEAEANDPKLLRAEIARLQRELRTPPKTEPTKADPKAVERAISVATKKHADFLTVETRKLKSLMGVATALKSQADSVISSLADRVGSMEAAAKSSPAIAPVVQISQRVIEPKVAPAPVRRDSSPSAPRDQRFLDAAASLTALGAEVTRETVCGWVGVHPRGGSVGEVLNRLVEAGQIEMDRGRITVTDSGQSAANHIDQAEAIDSAKRGLSPRQLRIFDIVCAVYPEAISREAIAEQMQIHPRGGSFGEDLGALTGRGLLEGGRGQYKARSFLFAGAA